MKPTNALRVLLFALLVLAALAAPASARQWPQPLDGCIAVSNQGQVQIIVTIRGQNYRVPAASVRTFGCVTYSD